MTDYPFDEIVAIDRVTGDRVVNGSGHVYAMDDIARANPLPVFDSTMLPLPDNKLTTNSEAYVPVFVVQDHWQVMFVSGTSEVPMVSHKGLKEAADAAASAAEGAAVDASASRAAAELAALNAGVEAAEAAREEIEARVAAGEFKGEPGLPGVNAVLNDEANEALIRNHTTRTAIALGDEYVRRTDVFWQDPDIPGVYLFDTTNSLLVEDPNDPGLYFMEA